MKPDYPSGRGEREQGAPARPEAQPQPAKPRSADLEPAIPSEPAGPGPAPAGRTGSVRFSVKFICGTAEPGCGCAPVRPGRYATQINIHNYSGETVEIRKRVIPVVLAGAPVGREPSRVIARAEDGMTLPPHTATMDDCCRIAELVFGAPVDAFTVGLLEIIASRDVAVAAVYTTAASLDIVAIQPHAV